MSDQATPHAAKQEPNFSVGSLAQLLYQLSNLNSAKGEAGAAQSAARDLNGNLIDRTIATNADADGMSALLKALQATINPDAGAVEGDIQNRTNQIFSALSGTVDRSNAIAGSKAGAGLLKRGMGDSSQASDTVNGLTRQYGDVYQKLQEMAHTQALQEQQQRQTQAQGLFGTAAQGVYSMNNSALNNAQVMATNAANASKTANANVGKNFTDTLGTGVAQWLMGKADSYLTDSFKNPNDGNGFSGISKALGGIFGGGNSATPSTFASSVKPSATPPWEASQQPASGALGSGTSDFGGDNFKWITQPQPAKQPAQDYSIGASGRNSMTESVSGWTDSYSPWGSSSSSSPSFYTGGGFNW